MTRFTEMISGGRGGGNAGRLTRFRLFMKACLFSFLFLLFQGESSLKAADLVINSDRQYDYAVSCFNNRDFDTAIIELKRFIHFFPGDQRVRDASFKTGMAAYRLKKYKQAAGIFDRMTRPFSQDEITIESYFMLSRTYGVMGKVGSAEITLRNLLKLSKEEAVIDRANLALTAIYLNRSTDLEPGVLDKARNHAVTISETGSHNLSREMLIKTINSIENLKEKDPIIAGLLSIVPGGGFAYCGRYRDALVSFLLNSALMLAAHESFKDGNNALGGVIGFVEAGFYSGNIYGSVSSAHKYNSHQRKRVIESLQRDMSLSRELSHTQDPGKVMLFSYRIVF